MRKRTLLFLVLTVLLGPAQDATADKQKNGDNATVIKNVTVISPERSAPLAHAVVVVCDGTIAEVGTDVVVPEHAKVIDGHGGFLIPGLIDSHVYVGNMGPLDDNAIEKHPELLEANRAQLPRSYLAFVSQRWSISTCAKKLSSRGPANSAGSLRRLVDLR